MPNKQSKPDPNIPVTRNSNGHTDSSTSTLAERRHGDVTRYGYGRLNPIEAMHELGQEVDSLLARMGIGALPLLHGMGHSGMAERRSAAPWSPQIEMKERDGRLIVCADLPGMNKGDIKVEMAEGVLTIQGTRHQEKSEDRDGIYHSERSYGSFRRNIPLPDNVDAEDVRANFQDGVLEVSMPMPPRKRQARQIEVQSHN